MLALRHLTVLHVVGARPNFMKVAPVLRALEARKGFRSILVHTGQHYDEHMSASFFDDLQIPHPDVNLGVGSGSHGTQTAAVMSALEPRLVAEPPDIVLVVGDVNSTLAAALTAAKLNIPVAHVEAGLRSGDRSMPEEINRVLTDQVAELCLTPSSDAADNLLREGIPGERIHFVGNVMVDSLDWHLPPARELAVPAEMDLERGRYVVVTLHRPSNVDRSETLLGIVEALDEIAAKVPVIFPVHPRTAARLDGFGITLRNVRMVAPMGYVHMLGLLEGAGCVLTDSGGVQEETTVLGVPCLTLRDSTERPVTLSLGTNRLVPDRSRASILEAFGAAWGSPAEGRRPELWDGAAAERIVDVLEAWRDGSSSPWPGAAARMATGGALNR